jgi:hypothetical protein
LKAEKSYLTKEFGVVNIGLFEIGGQSLNSELKEEKE